ncbi:hypothetical protein A2U01_0079299, partial [Trifolium medium]|nr:hypothetical protein [Trifolium medium]
LKSLENLAPEDALERLLSRHGGDNNESNPSAADKERALQLEQAALELRFKQEILEGNMLEEVEKDPTSYFGIKAFLSNLQTTRTNEALLLL